MKIVAHLNLAKGIRGGENQTMILVRSLQDCSEFKHILVCRNEGELHKQARKFEVNHQTFSKPFLLHLFKLNKYDLVHVHEGRSGLIALMGNLFFNIPYIFTRRIPNRPKNRFLTRLKYSKALAIVSLSNKINGVMNDYKREGKFYIIPDIARKLKANEENLAKLKQRFEDKFVIGHVGALINDKNQSLIIKSAKKMLAYKNVVFLLLGSGIDEERLKEEAKGLDNLIFEGQKNNIADYYSLFNVFVFPSKAEGLGSSILEAFGFNLPVIASNIDGIPDIISSGDNGVLVEPDDVTGFTLEILKMVNDKNHRNKIGTSGFNTLVRYSKEKIAADYEKLYGDILH